MYSRSLGMKSNYKQLGEIVRWCDERNRNAEDSEVLGVSIGKEYIPSVANIIGTDLSNYKLVRKNRFACNPMHVGRDKVLPIALYSKKTPAIVSPAYFTFEVINTDEVLPEYLMLLFSTPIFDKNCWFRTDGTVRGGISWDDLCRVELPVPDIENQKSICRLFYNIKAAIRNTAKSLKVMRSIARLTYHKICSSTIIKYNTPSLMLSDLAEHIICGKTPSTEEESNYGGEIPFVTIPDMHLGPYIVTTDRKLTKKGALSQAKKTLPAGSVVVSCIGTVGLVGMLTEKSQTNQQINAIIPKKEYPSIFLYELSCDLAEKIKRFSAGGSTIGNLNKTDFGKLDVSIPQQQYIDIYSVIAAPIYRKILILQKKLILLQNIHKQITIKLI